jgi:hypothetical protein
MARNEYLLPYADVFKRLKRFGVREHRRAADGQLYLVKPGADGKGPFCPLHFSGEQAAIDSHVMAMIFRRFDIDRTEFQK